MIICYMAGPIDYAHDKGKGWKEELLDLCANHTDIGFFDPYAPFKFKEVNTKIAAYIHDINMVALDEADIVVGSLMKGQTSVGTPIEFYHAASHNKPMVIRTDMVDSVYLQHMGSAKNVYLVENVITLYRGLIHMSHNFKDDKPEDI